MEPGGSQKIVKLFLCKAILPSLDFARHDILGLKMSSKYGTFLFVTRLSNHGTNIYGFFWLVSGLCWTTEMPQKHRLKYRKNTD